MRAEIFKQHADNLFLVGPIVCARPRVIIRNLKCNLAHYFSALWGIGLQFEAFWDTPNFGRYGPAIAFWLVLGLFTLWTGAPLLYGALIAFWVSPLWVYALAPLNDAVFEYRAYLAVAGWGLLLAIAPAVLVWPLILVWAGQSYRRSRYFQSNVQFWRQAELENPRIHPQRAHNPGYTYWDAGLHDEAIASFNRMVRFYPDENRKLYLGRQGCAVERLIKYGPSRKAKP